MNQIVRAFAFVFLAMIFVIIGFGTISAVTDQSQAKDYKAAVIDEIENSNFNNDVITSCKDQASKDGYKLTVNKIVTDPDENKQVAEVILHYKFRIPIFNINDDHVTRGMAR